MSSVVDFAKNEFDSDTEAGVSEESKTILRTLLGIAEDYYFPASREMITTGRRFYSLQHVWLKDTQFKSSLSDIVLHPAYQQIIGMGPRVLPFLIQELEKDSGYYFWALKAITGEDPVSEQDRGNVDKMKKTWRDWAVNKGFF